MEKALKQISIIKNNGNVKEINGKMYPICDWDYKYNKIKQLEKK